MELLEDSHFKMWRLLLCSLIGIIYYCPCSTEPILDVEVGKFRSKITDIPSVIRYVDLPMDILLKYEMNCRFPKADNYQWFIYGKLGAPYPLSVTVDIESKKETPWLKYVSKFLLHFSSNRYDTAKFSNYLLIY